MTKLGRASTVVTTSFGNHGLAVAYVANRLGLPRTHSMQQLMFPMSLVKDSATSFIASLKVGKT